MFYGEILVLSHIINLITIVLSLMKSMNELLKEVATIFNEIVELQEKEQKANANTPSNNLDAKLLEELKGIRSKDYYSKKLDIKDIFAFYLVSWDVRISEKWSYLIMSFCFSILLLAISLSPMEYCIDVGLSFVGFIMSFLFSLNMVSYIEIYSQFERMREIFIQSESKYVFLHDSKAIQHLKNVCRIDPINTKSWQKRVCKCFSYAYFLIYFCLLKWWVFPIKLDQHFISINVLNNILYVLGIVGLLFFLMKRYDRKSVL